MKDYLLERLKEPSTWRGIVLIATAAGATITPALADAIVAAGIGFAGLIAVATPDKQVENNETKQG